MSVSAHLTEIYFAKYKLPTLNFRWLVVGCYFPDGWGLSKLLLITTGNPLFHRDILFGWTHSLPVSAAVAWLIGAVFGRRAGWSFGFAAGLHVLMDLGDPIGVKLFFPFLDHKYALALWPWTDGDLLFDMTRYYAAPISLITEAGCLLLAVYGYRRLTGTYNPFTATRRLWMEAGWFDRPADRAGADAGRVGAKASAEAG